MGEIRERVNEAEEWSLGQVLLGHPVCVCVCVGSRLYKMTDNLKHVAI